LADSWFKEDIMASPGDVGIGWMDPLTNDGKSDIAAPHLSTPSGATALV